MANRQPTRALTPHLPIPRTPHPTDPIPYTLTPAALALPNPAEQLLADLETVDYDRLSEWDVVELIGRTTAILGDLIRTSEDEVA
jgi:hypothetical protein